MFDLIPDLTTIPAEIARIYSATVKVADDTGKLLTPLVCIGTLVPWMSRAQKTAPAERRPLFGWSDGVFTEIVSDNIDPDDVRTFRYQNNALNRIRDGGMLPKKYYVDPVVPAESLPDPMMLRDRRVLHQNLITIGGPRSKALARLTLGYDPQSDQPDSRYCPPYTFQLGDLPRTIVENYGDGVVLMENFPIVATRGSGVRYESETRLLRTSPHAHSITSDATKINPGFGLEDARHLFTSYALLTVAPNPFFPSTSHVIISGTHGVGVDFLTQAMGDEPLRKEIEAARARYTHFQMILRARVEINASGSYAVNSKGKIEIVGKPVHWHTCLDLSPAEAEDRYRRIRGSPT